MRAIGSVDKEKRIISYMAQEMFEKYGRKEIGLAFSQKGVATFLEIKDTDNHVITAGCNYNIRDFISKYEYRTCVINEMLLRAIEIFVMNIDTRSIEGDRRSKIQKAVSLPK